MTVYTVRKIELKPGMTFTDRIVAYEEAEKIYCKGMKEVEKFVGGKLHRGRCGYSGIVGNTEYIAEKSYTIKEV